jgi:hypothetical protein
MRVWLFAILVTGCPRNSNPPTDHPGSGAREASVVEAVALDQDLPKLAERGVQLYQDVAAAFAAAGEDCASATTRLSALSKTYADVVVANAKVVHEGRAMELKIALRQFDLKFEEAAKAIMQGKTMPACAQDEAFGKAFNNLVGTPP